MPGVKLLTSLPGCLCRARTKLLFALHDLSNQPMTRAEGCGSFNTDGKEGPAHVSGMTSCSWHGSVRQLVRSCRSVCAGNTKISRSGNLKKLQGRNSTFEKHGRRTFHGGMSSLHMHEGLVACSRNCRQPEELSRNMRSKCGAFWTAWSAFAVFYSFVLSAVQFRCCFLVFVVRIIVFAVTCFVVFIHLWRSLCNRVVFLRLSLCVRMNNYKAVRIIADCEWMRIQMNLGTCTDACESWCICTDVEDSMQINANPNEVAHSYRFIESWRTCANMRSSMQISLNSNRSTHLIQMRANRYMSARM